MRVCLDTNVLVAAFATRGLCADVLRTVLADHELVLGEVHHDELRWVLEGKFGPSSAQIDAVLAALPVDQAVARPAAPHAHPVAEPDDAWVLVTAVLGRADILVTGDRHLLDSADGAPLPIVTPRGFWLRLRGEA